uniref:Ataxin-2 C-terminal domain-containing protein n=2 Tax=Oncorhynchus TaxID=8016 RepID=A0A8K9X3D5_ONCMY
MFLVSHRTYLTVPMILHCWRSCVVLHPPGGPLRIFSAVKQEPSEMSGPEVAKTPGGRAPGKEGMEAVANGHAGEGEQGGDDPFAEYMWMENEDAYNRQVEEELLEQEFLERCFQEMLDEEDQDWFIPARDLPSGMGQLQQQLNGLSVSDRGNAEEMARKSNLNPDAKEFVPGVKY